MIPLAGFFGYPLVHALGWTLVHFCWQGALVAGMLWCVLGLLGGRSSQARYRAACVAMLLMVALPLITFARIAADEYHARSVAHRMAMVLDMSMFLQVGADGSGAPWPLRIVVALDRAMPWLLCAWLLGALFFVVRLNFGLVAARRLSRIGIEPPSAALQQMFEALCRRIGVLRVVRLLHSARVQVPTVIGWLRPVVLIPVSCLAGLSTDQVEAILCHELAHVRRHDYLVSVFQSLAEALLFYHPAVWWVSKQVRRERECCCDEFALANGGDALAYARALSYLEERRAAFPEFSLGANGGVLTMRIKRLLGYSKDAGAPQFAAFLLFALVVAISGLYVATLARAQNTVHATTSVAAVTVIGESTGLQSRLASVAGTLSPMKVSLERRGDTEQSQRASAQVDSAIAGVVMDQTGAVIARASVKATSANGSLTIASATDAGGRYSLSPLPAGRCTVAVRAPGFANAAQQNVEVHGSQQVGLNLKLKVGAVEQSLTVAAPPVSALMALPPVLHAPEQGPAPVGPIRVSPGTMAGAILTKVDPVYPEMAKAAHVSGTVVLRATISKQGRVENVEWVSGPPMLISSSVDAVKQWTYSPYLLNGEPVEVATTINVNYTFGEAEPPADPGAGEAGLTANVSTGVGGSRMADGATTPIVIYTVEPQFTEEARKAKVMGTVLVKMTVDTEGRPENVHVVRRIGYGLDQKAVEAVSQYRFKPAMKHDKPVEEALNIEVNFQIF
jgi:TonB family protein